MEHWKIIALSIMGIVWLCSVCFVAWLYPKDYNVLPFRKKRQG